MTAGSPEQPFPGSNELFIADAHGRIVSRASAPEQGEVEVTNHQLEAARAAYVEVYEEPVIDGHIRTFLLGHDTSEGEARNRRGEYFEAITDTTRHQLDAGTEEHSDITTQAVELAGNEWNAFNGALYEARRDQQPSLRFRRHFGNRALIAAEVAASAGIASQTQLGLMEVVVPPLVIGATATLRRSRPDAVAIDKVFSATQDRGPVEQDTIKLLNELGLGNNATNDTARRDMQRWLKRNKPSVRKKASGHTISYDTVKARFSELENDTDIEEFRVHSATELTFAALEQAQYDALRKERLKENKWRFIAGSVGYVALTALLYGLGVSEKEEITPDERGPSIIEPSPTNTGPDDGVSEEPLPSDAPSVGYFDNE